MENSEGPPISRQLASYRRHRERILAERRVKYHEDAAFRQRMRERGRRRYREDENYRNAVQTRNQQRRRTVGQSISGVYVPLGRYVAAE